MFEVVQFIGHFDQGIDYANLDIVLVGFGRKVENSRLGDRQDRLSTDPDTNISGINKAVFGIHFVAIQITLTPIKFKLGFDID